MNADEAFKVMPPDPDRIVLQRTTASKPSLDPIIAMQLSAWLKAQVELYQNTFGALKIFSGAARSPSKLLAQIRKEKRY